MTDLELALRAVACPGWVWLRGCPWVVPGVTRGVAEVGKRPPGAALPDLREPAAEGCLLACVSRALSASWAHLVPFPTHVCDDAGGLKPTTWWAVSVTEDGAPLVVEQVYGCRYLAGPTRVHALVEALEYAGRQV